jgi:hypothetical protein
MSESSERPAEPVDVTGATEVGPTADGRPGAGEGGPGATEGGPGATEGGPGEGGGGAPRVEAEVETGTATVSRGAVGVIRARHVQLSTALAALVVSEEDVTVARGAARTMIAGEGLQISQGGAGTIVAGGRTSIVQGGAGTLVSAGEVSVERGGAGIMLAPRISLGRYSFVALAVTPDLRTGDGGRVLMRMRGSTAMAVAGLVALSVVSKVVRRARRSA